MAIGTRKREEVEKTQNARRIFGVDCIVEGCEKIE
jgi:hypothetical protein